MKKEKLSYEVPEARLLAIRIEQCILSQIDSGSGNDEEKDK